MSYVIKTKGLQAVVDALSDVMAEVKHDRMDAPKAGAIIRAGSSITRAHEVDLRVRLSSKKLAEVESDQAAA